MSGFEDLFVNSAENQQALEGLDNPYSLNFSFNLTFADTSRITTTGSSSNITVSNGQLVLSSGSNGTAVSVVKNLSFDATTCHLKVLGEELGNFSFRLSTDGGNSWQSILPNVLTALTNSGRSLIIEITFNSANARLNSLALLFS